MLKFLQEQYELCYAEKDSVTAIIDRLEKSDNSILLLKQLFHSVKFGHASLTKGPVPCNKLPRISIKQI